MLSVLLAITATTATPGIAPMNFGPCAPNKHTACAYPARSAQTAGIPVGKRCHPDPTKSFGCRETLPHEAERRATVAAR